jgi:hypothetical protein
MTLHNRLSSDRQPSCSCRCGARAFAPRLARHSPVQTACPERAMPQVWLALAGGRAAPCAASPGHRTPVPSGRGKMQGKIEGCGTTVRTKPVCTWGWRGTRLIAAPCREQSQSRVGIGETTCIAPSGALDCAGVAA